MILDNPKSAMRRSEFSAGVRNRRFSGFKSNVSRAVSWVYLDVRFRDHGGKTPLIRLCEQGLQHLIHSNSPFDIFYRTTLLRDINR
jgi:hypothetical protein